MLRLLLLTWYCYEFYDICLYTNSQCFFKAKFNIMH